MKGCSVRRGGTVYVEILFAVLLFALIAVPLIGSFQTGAKQTRLIKSHSSARYLADWAISSVRAEIDAGNFDARIDDDEAGDTCAQIAADNFGDTATGSGNPDDLTAQAQASFPELTSQLGELVIRRSIRCSPVLATQGPGEDGTRIFDVEVSVLWKDPGQPQLKRLTLYSVEGEEI